MIFLKTLFGNKKLSFWFYIFCGLIIAVISNLRGSNILGIFLLILVFLIIAIALLKYPDSKLRKILFIAFFIRFGLVLFHEFISPLPGSLGDAVYFEKRGWEIAEAWLVESEIAPDFSGTYFYSAVIAIPYYIFGRIEIIPQFVNVVLGVVTVFIVYKITIELGEKKINAHVASLITTFFPTMNLYSAITMRESFIIAFAAISIYYFICWLKRGSLLKLFWAIGTLLISSIFHGGMILIALVYLFFFSFYNPVIKRWNIFNIKFIVIVCIFILLVGMFSGVLGNLLVEISKIPNDLSLMIDINFYKRIVETKARDRAKYLPNLIPNSFKDLIIQTPLRIMYFLFTPFPWMVSNLTDIIGFIDAIIYFILFYYSLKSLLYLKNRDKAICISLFLIIGVFLIVFSWGTSNYGTALRHRQKIAFLMISVASLSISQGFIGKLILMGKK